MEREVLEVKEPLLRDYMTPAPVSIRRGSTLAEAIAAMRQGSIRHLPVLDGEELVGIVSHRDVHLPQSIEAVYADRVTVGEVMTAAPYRVAPDRPVFEVALAMWEHKYGSAVVEEGGRVVGIFTTTDALRALVELLARVRRGGTSETDTGEPPAT